jgi:type II secretory pathway pseudopilin PulG
MYARRTADKRALSIVEILTVISILGIMAAVLLPAVQRSRESVRRLQCASNLRQIGVALQAYAATFGEFPLPGSCFFDVAPHDFSPQSQLLPYFGAEAIYNALNFSEWLGFDGGRWRIRANQTAAQQRIALFLCPSDPFDRLRPGNNYRACLGIGPGISAGGLFAICSNTNPAYVSDGLAHTAAFSEKLRGDGTPATYTAESEYFWAPVTLLMETGPEARSVCSRAPSSNPPHDSLVGVFWIPGNFNATFYNHVFTPNSRIPDCTADMHTLSGAFAARSHHLGGVNLLLADGGTRFVVGSITEQVWHALATPSGREQFDEDY